MWCGIFKQSWCSAGAQWKGCLKSCCLLHFLTHSMFCLLAQVYVECWSACNHSSSALQRCHNCHLLLCVSNELKNLLEEHTWPTHGWCLVLWHCSPCHVLCECTSFAFGGSVLRGLPFFFSSEYPSIRNNSSLKAAIQYAFRGVFHFWMEFSWILWFLPTQPDPILHPNPCQGAAGLPFWVKAPFLTVCSAAV